MKIKLNKRAMQQYLGLGNIIGKEIDVGGVIGNDTISITGKSLMDLGALYGFCDDFPYYFNRSQYDLVGEADEQSNN